MNPWKGQYELIGAASRLREAFPNLHVMILGADVPEIRADFERKAREGGIADRLHCAGFQKDVRPFLREFDVFVHLEDRSAEAVATAISVLLNDRELGRQLGGRARKTVRDRFSPRQQCAAVAQRYADLISAA